MKDWNAEVTNAIIMANNKLDEATYNWVAREGRMNKRPCPACSGAGTVPRYPLKWHYSRGVGKRVEDPSKPAIGTKMCTRCCGTGKITVARGGRRRKWRTR